MVSEETTAKIKKIFPVSEIGQDYDNHQARVTVNHLDCEQMRGLCNLSDNESMIYITVNGNPDYEKVDVIFGESMPVGG